MAELKFSNIINKMTLEEKASLMSGANFWNTKELERLNIPSMMLTDGPHGLRKQGGKADHLGLNKSIPATCFPTAATIANSWDVSIAKEVGEYIGKEAANEDVSVLLGPGLNVKRNPLCGRNFEYFSEDPYLSGKMASAMVMGIQSNGISACPKHFVVNSQETHRMTIDEIVDKRALHEIYLEGFRYTVKEGKAKSIMTSYNKVNGTYANENEYLLNDILRNKWGFDGLVVTDWGGNNDRVLALKAGNALEMPSTNGETDKGIIESVKKGEIEESVLDKRVDELLDVIYTVKDNVKKTDFTMEEHHVKAVELASKCIVLLKNDGILPLKNREEKIAIIGDFAKKSRYQGAGSSLINPYMLDNFYDVFTSKGYNVVGYQKGYKRLGGTSNILSKKACVLAENADKVILFLGLDEGSEAEGVDRKHMKINENQLRLLDKLYESNKNIIVVLSGGSPVEMPFANKCKAIVHGYLLGQGSGVAMTNVISGKVNPSGKLSESYPLRYEDIPSSLIFPGKEATSEHRESIYVGYRYFDSAKKEVQYPFGYGLSYTTFKYSDLTVEGNEAKAIITNIGDCKGSEVVQLYIKSKRSKTFKAEKELKAFAKVELEKGESKEVTLVLDEHAFSHFDIKENDWVIEDGKYDILVGSSSRDIHLKKPIEVIGLKLKSKAEKTKLLKYYNKDVINITKEDFELLYGEKIPSSLWDENKDLSYNDMIVQAKDKSVFGKCLYGSILSVNKFFRVIGKPILANNVYFVLELPFRSVSRMSTGKINMAQLDGILLMVNGEFVNGLKMFVKNSKYFGV
ncbi:MAG: glycoside hydrolase family 3 C-terminal domain-containing protein [Lachnospirales bacterium]